MMSVAWSMAQVIAATSARPLVASVVSKTLRVWRLASGAFSRIAAATAVPCPNRSVTSLPTWPYASNATPPLMPWTWGCAAWMPLSTTATVTPRPVRPASAAREMVKGSGAVLGIPLLLRPDAPDELLISRIRAPRLFQASDVDHPAIVLSNPTLDPLQDLRHVTKTPVDARNVV